MPDLPAGLLDDLAVVGSVLLAEVTQSNIWHSIWDFAQQVATFAVALIAIWAGAIRPYLARKEAERKAEIIARDKAREDELRRQVEEAVAPIRRQVDAIHHTTHINGGQNDPPTLRDEVSHLRKQQDTAIRAVGAVAVNQAHLADQFDQHIDGSDRFLREARRILAEHGIELPAGPNDPGELPDR